MKTLSEQRATLIAAWISTAAALLAASLAFWSGRQVADIENKGAEQRELASFRRSQIDQCSKLAIESSIELCAEFRASTHVAWISEAREITLVEQSSKHIERLKHAHAALVAMNAISTNAVVKVEIDLGKIGVEWQTFSSSRSAYRNAVTNGDIQLNGQVITDAGAEAEKKYIEARGKMDSLLVEIQKAVAEIYGTTSIPSK